MTTDGEPHGICRFYVGATGKRVGGWGAGGLAGGSLPGAPQDLRRAGEAMRVGWDTQKKQSRSSAGPREEGGMRGSWRWWEASLCRHRAFSLRSLCTSIIRSGALGGAYPNHQPGIDLPGVGWCR